MRSRFHRSRFARQCDEEAAEVFYEDWCVALVGGFLSLEDLGRWDVAMCSRREEWLQTLSTIKIADVDDYCHRRNESVRWLISRRIHHVTKITIGEDCESEICSKTFFGARVLANLKSINVKNGITDGILDSFKVNCQNLEEVHIACDSIGNSTSFTAATRMVQKLPRLRCFTFTCTESFLDDDLHEDIESPIVHSSTPLLLALAQYCPLLESLNLVRYDDEGLAELVAGCKKLHTLTIDADTYGVSLLGFRALGRSRSITTLYVNTRAINNRGRDTDQVLRAMADEGMPIKSLELHSSNRHDDDSFDDGVAAIARFARTLENLTLKDLSHLRDEGLKVLRQCHNLRSIDIENAEGAFEGDEDYGVVTGSFLILMSIGCPLLERVTVNGIRPHEGDERDPQIQAANFKPFFERCPNLKHFEADIRTDEEVKALVQHCPLVEYIKLGSSDFSIPQEHSEISDLSLVAIAQGLSSLTHMWLNHTQCTDAGLLELATKGDFFPLKTFRIHNGSWEKGYPQLITEKGIEMFYDKTYDRDWRRGTYPCLLLDHGTCW